MAVLAFALAAPRKRRHLLGLLGGGYYGINGPYSTLTLYRMS